MKDSFGDAIAIRLVKNEAEANFADGRVNDVIHGAQEQFSQIEKEAGKKIEELDARLHLFYVAANQHLIQMGDRVPSLR